MSIIYCEKHDLKLLREERIIQLADYATRSIHGDQYKVATRLEIEQVIRQALREAALLAAHESNAAAQPSIADDVCGFCGLSGADKIPHPVRWPGEVGAGTDLVHSDCENAEGKRAHAL